MSLSVLKNTKQQPLTISGNQIAISENLVLPDFITYADDLLDNIPTFEYDEETGEINIVLTKNEPKLDYFWIDNLEDEAGEVVFSLEGSSNTMPVTLEYSIDEGESWTEFNTSELTSDNISLSIAIPANTTMYLRGNNGCFGISTSEYTKISCSKHHNIGGNLVSLLNKDLVESETFPNYCFAFLFYSDTKLIDASKLIMPSKTSNYCYFNMFKGCTSLTTTPKLPATKLAEYCYQYMFQGCTSLTTAPVLPATTLTNGCYSGIFSGCTSLTTAPALPATTLANYCYSDIFSGCTSLTTAPALPATTLAVSCYSGMFSNCTSLNTAPELPVTTLANGCYAGMFYSCTSLTTAPELPATTLTTWCYSNMFEGCTNLNYVKAMFTSIGANSLLNWFYRTASSGTFVKNPEANWTKSDLGLPSGWTIEDAAA